MWTVKKKGSSEKTKMEAYNIPDGHPSKYAHLPMGLTSVIGLELVCNGTSKGDEGVTGMVVENGQPNFYFPFIWVGCIGLAPFRTKSIYIFSKNQIKVWFLSLVSPCRIERTGSRS